MDNNFFSVLYNYNEDGPQRIKLYVGDTVNIVEENAGKFYIFHSRCEGIIDWVIN